MSKLRLGPIVEDKPVKLTVELPGTLLRHLGDYAKTMRARMASPNHSPSTTYAGAVPAANATVARTNTVRLTFSEGLMPKLSTATLVMTGMPGTANHPEMKMTGVTSAVAADGKSIVLTSANPLPAGSYRADWVIVGADTHRITGKHSFSVR